MTKMPTKKPDFPPIPKKFLKTSTLENMLKNLSTRLQDPASHGERRRLMEQAMAITQEALTMVKDSHEMKNEVNVLKGRITWRAMRIAAWTMELDKEMKALDSETDPARLRSILHAIKTQSMEWFEDTERSRAIEEEAIQKLSHRLKSWAEYGRLISENLQGVRPIEAIDLGQAARASVERWRAHAEKKKLNLTLEAGQNLMVRGDRGLVEQVIENLIDNAIKATARGKVDVLCRPEPAGILLEVRDTGCGIPQEDLVRIFEKPFYQSRAPRARETNTGVGLYLVSQYVRSLGGQVWAESRVDKGSSFFVQLPRYNQDRLKTSA
jgi:signal transduction histidine kinase